MENNRSLLETLADIAYAAGYHRYHVDDSRQVISNLIDWALEFETLHQHVDWDEGEMDYIETIDGFIYRKLKGHVNEEEVTPVF